MSDVMRLMQIELDARRDKIREQEQIIAQQAQEIERVTKELNHQTRQRAYEIEASQKQAQEIERLKGKWRE